MTIDSAATQTVNATPSSTTSAAPPSGVDPAASAASQPRNPDGTFAHQYVFGPNDNVPEWMKNKTREQIAAQSQEMYQALVSGQLPSSTPQPQPTWPPQQQAPQNWGPQPPPSTPPGPQLPDPDLWQTDPQTAFQQQAQFWAQQNLNPQLDQLYAGNAELAKQTIRQARSDDFARWGPEIEMELRKVSNQYVTPSLVEQAVDLVRGRHANELAEDLAQRRAEQLVEQRMAGGLRPDGASAGGASISAPDTLDLDSDQIPEETRMRWKRQGITNETVDEFLVNTLVKTKGISLRAARQQFKKMLEGGQALVAGESQ